MNGGDGIDDIEGVPELVQERPRWRPPTTVLSDPSERVKENPSCRQAGHEKWGRGGAVAYEGGA